MTDPAPGTTGRRGVFSAAPWWITYPLQRLAIAVPLLVLVAVVNFVIIQLAPGDPVTALIGDYPASPEYIAEVRERYGLDRSLLEQLALYLGALLTGDLGTSYSWRMPVAELVADRVPATLTLTGSAFLVSTAVGVLLGIAASRRANGVADVTIRASALFAFSIPGFWLAQILLLIFAVGLGWFPVAGDGPLRGVESPLESLRYLVLPVAALAAREIAMVSRITRTSLLEVSGQDYLTAARARGRRRAAILRTHELRNAAPPVITVIGMNLGYLIAGSVLIETVFSWPGIGRLLYDAIGSRDYPVMSAILLLVSATVIVANLVTDIVIAALDPRVRTR